MEYDVLKLINKGRDMLSFSYSPYSNFKVGSAVLFSNGKIYGGTNIENSSYGATICAERSAFANAICNGEKPSDAIAITIISSIDDFCYPCGICRQFLSEFGLNLDIVVVKNSKSIEYKIYKISELFPNGFTLSE